MFVYNSTLSTLDLFFIDFTSAKNEFENIVVVLSSLVNNFYVIDSIDSIDVSNTYNSILIAHIDCHINENDLVKLSTLNKYLPVLVLSNKDNSINLNKILGFNFEYFILDHYDKDMLVVLLNNILAKQEKEQQLVKLTEELEQKNQELEHKINITQTLAHYDCLTQLPNRRFFTAKVKETIEHVKINNQQFALMFIDLDNFKYVNDSLGHEIGDELLLAVTQRIQSTLSQKDTLSRLGGDEFTIIIEDFRYKKDLEVLANTIIGLLKKAFVIDSKEIFIGSSIGISLYPEHSISHKDLIKFADTAMYYVKNHGKNSFVFFNTKMTDFSNERLEIETNLRKSLENSEFLLLYQPKVNLTTNTTLSVEALVRFENKVLKQKPLFKCIDIAEETGLIIPITEWIIRESCKQIREWIDLGYGFLRIAINISTRMFRDESLVVLIEKLLSEYNLEPKNLEIEITETTLMNYLEKSIQVLQKLASMGIKIAIDDFGTGYSSMSYLKTLPIDFIKIDKSFITEIHTKKGNAIVTAIIAMAKSLDIKIIAEGVEDIFQLEILKQKGCDIVQGYYYSKPITNEELIENIKKQNELNKELNILHNKVLEILNSKKINSNKDIVIIKFSIAGFSLISREYGFNKENIVSQMIASIVKNNIRVNDIFARTSNEEFLIIIQSDIDVANKLANRIKETIREYDFGIVWKLNPSFYITEIDINDTKDTVLSRIDKPICKIC